ncbi:MAG: transglutaminase family protein [Verrucomicrobiales bacterium]
MKVRVRYETEYRYAEEVSFSPQVFRLFPKADTHIAIERTAFETNDGAKVHHGRDLFDNIVASCFYPGCHTALRCRLEVELRLDNKNPFHFLLAPHALDFPFSYQPDERRVLEPFLDPLAPRVELPFWRLEPKPTVAALIELNNAVFHHLKYERREEGVARAPAETLAAGGGACRDFALLLAETLRASGVAARLASGYLWEGNSSGPRRAEGALHAWVEAYLPGAGWVGIDPANGIFCDHNHITAAVGLRPVDVAPISGRFFADRPVSSAMSASLEISQCPEK